MSHDTPARVRIAHYPFTGRVATRYADLDPQVHVNNVAVAALHEEGRSQFLRWLTGLADTTLEPANRLIAEVRIGYLAQIAYPSMLTVAGGILRIGRSSYVIAQGLFLDSACVGLCETVFVHSDGLHSAAITPAWRGTLERALLVPVEPA